MNWILSYFDSLLAFYLEIAPLLLLGLAVAGVLHLLFPEYLIERHLGGRGVSSVVKATLFGIPIPLCSCSVIPVMTSLKRKGASNGATVSFLVGAPQIGADSWLLTYGLLGPLFAVFRIGAALVTALVAGLVENLLPEERRRTETPAAAAHAPVDASWQDRGRRLFTYLNDELLGSIADSLILGILLAALITVIVPDTLFAGLGANAPWISMLVMLAIGIPMYVCATASTPIAAALLLKGISPGAALVFLLAGPATNAITVSTVYRTLGRRPTIIYLVTIAVVALGAGFLMDAFFLGQIRAQTQGHHHHFQPGILHWLGGALLAGLLARHYLLRWLPGPRTPGTTDSDSLSILELQVEGMTCNHCERRLVDALQAALPLKGLDVSHEKGEVRMAGDTPWTGERIRTARAAVEAAGFLVVGEGS